MTREEREAALKRLDFLSGSLESQDEFAELHAKLFEACRVENDLGTASEMQKIAYKQFAFLSSEWIKEQEGQDGEDDAAKRNRNDNASPPPPSPPTPPRTGGGHA